MRFFDFEAFERFAAEAVTHYQASAPAVSRYLDELYVRVSTGEGRPVLLDEVIACQRINQDGEYMQANYAANYIYHLLDRLGQPTAGMLDF